MGSLNKIFGGGKAQTDFRDLEKLMNLENEMNMRNKYGLFSNQEWREGEDGRMGMYQSVNPALQGGYEGLMSRMGSSDPYKGYSSPSWMNDLLESRGAHQFERMNMQMPGQMPPGSPMAGQLPAGPMPPGAGGPMPPGAAPGPMPPGASMPGRGGMMGSIMGSGMTPTPDQVAAATPVKAPPEWAQNQRFGGLVGGIEGAIDARKRNQGLPEDQQQNLIKAFLGGI